MLKWLAIHVVTVFMCPTQLVGYYTITTQLTQNFDRMWASTCPRLTSSLPAPFSMGSCPSSVASCIFPPSRGDTPGVAGGASGSGGPGPGLPLRVSHPIRRGSHTSRAAAWAKSHDQRHITHPHSPSPPCPSHIKCIHIFSNSLSVLTISPPAASP